MQQCSICGTTDFSAPGCEFSIPLICADCKGVFCVPCAGRFTDHSGARMFSCPKCSSRSILPANPTPEMSHAIREAILAQLPEADIRTDQCSTIRVYWRDVCGGISPLENGEFRVSAGDAQAQYDNLVFESSFSTTSPTQAAAVDNLVNACRSIVTQREQDAQQ